jgi:hypothetical protein
MLRTLVELQPPEFMTLDDLPEAAQRWVYEGLANKYQLLGIRSQHGRFTDMFLGEVPDPVWGTISVVAVNRRSLVKR